MKREYFCGGCGLFHWADQYVTDEETGRIDRVPYEGCPNPECVSQDEHDIPVYPVDTMGYAYFSMSHQEFIDEVKWSSPLYAPEDAIEVYKNQGIPIKV